MSFNKISTLGLLLIIPMALQAHGVSIDDQNLLSQGNLFTYILIGAKHMVTGYDHLLFLAGVIFYLNNFKDILKFITVFTVGHSITLIGATYLGIKADEHLIDAVIALSVLYKGLENLGVFNKLFDKSIRHLLTMVLIFGLIHGFGLSTRLQSFDMGESQFLPKIISFNIGVELGQIIALIPIVYLISKWKNLSSYREFYKLANAFLVLAGILLFIYQLSCYFQHAQV